MGFWTDNFFEPKFTDRFVVELRIDEDYLVKWYNVKSVDLPSFEVGTQTYKLLNREIKFPKNIVWNPIKIVLTETKENATLHHLRRHYEGHAEDQGHFLYKHDYTLDSTISKEKSFQNNMIIRQYDADGNIIDTWEIENFHIKNVDFSQANYSESNIRETSLTIEYEWAYLGLKEDGAKEPVMPPEEPEVIIEDPVMKKGKWKEKIPEQKAKDNVIPLDPKNPPKNRKEVQQVEQDLQRFAGTLNPSKEQVLKRPKKKMIKPIDRMPSPAAPKKPAKVITAPSPTGIDPPVNNN